VSTVDGTRCAAAGSDAAASNSATHHAPARIRAEE
jgi:hypothetical protein